VSGRYDLDRLRAAFAQPDDAPHPDQCPSLSEIWDGVHGKLSAGRLREVVEHLASCSPCAEAWRVALAMERPEQPEATPAEEPPAGHLVRGQWWRVSGGLAVAAAAVFAVVLGVHQARRGEPPTVIAQRGATEARTAVRWLIPNESVLPRSGARLRWSGPPGTTYDLTVELIDERGVMKPTSIAAARSLAATDHVLPAGKLQRLPAGALVQAILTAHLPDGRSETISRDLRLR
jgi:hypothetical protein